LIAFLITALIVS